MGRPMLMHDLFGSRHSRFCPILFRINYVHTETSKLRYKANIFRFRLRRLCQNELLGCNIPQTGHDNILISFTERISKSSVSGGKYFSLTNYKLSTTAELPYFHSRGYQDENDFISDWFCLIYLAISLRRVLNTGESRKVSNLSRSWTKTKRRSMYLGSAPRRESFLNRW